MSLVAINLHMAEDRLPGPIFKKKIKTFNFKVLRRIELEFVFKVSLQQSNLEEALKAF